MMENIEDDEIRIIGSQESNESLWKKHWWKWLLGLVVLVGSVIVFFELRPTMQNPLDSPTTTHDSTSIHLFTAVDSLQQAGVELVDTTVADIPIRIYIPQHLVPRLELGYNCIEDTIHNLMFFQAADIRADNGQIVGAFVLRGEPLSWGKSKQGYCGIIHDTIHLGVADNSPLFEEATDCGGYFFRQYPLVDQGKMVHNALELSSIRLALCAYQQQVFVVETRRAITLDEFANMLVQLPVDNAIYLVGSSSIRWCRTMDGRGHASGIWQPRKLENVNFIVWSEPAGV